jgi:hypothetical protein
MERNTIEGHLARGRIRQTQNSPAGCRLSAAALSGQPKDLTALDIEAHSIYGTHVALSAAKQLVQEALLYREPFLEILDVNENVSLSWRAHTLPPADSGCF